jgi:hypothetical protein
MAFTSVAYPQAGILCIDEIQALNSGSTPVSGVGEGVSRSRSSDFKPKPTGGTPALPSARRAPLQLPAVICGMAFFHRHENSVTGRAHFPTRGQSSFHRRAILRRIDNFGRKKYRIIRRRGPRQFDGVFRRDRAWSGVRLGALHQMIGRSPIAVTIEQCSDNAPVQHTGKCFVFWFRLPFGDDFIVLGKTADAQSIRVSRTTAPARILWCIFFLKRFVTHAVDQNMAANSLNQSIALGDGTNIADLL